MELIRIEDVAVRTAQPLGRLRRWCATGLLNCERDGGSWWVPEHELLRVIALADERIKTAAEQRAIALSVPKQLVRGDIAWRVENELGIPAGSIAMTTIVIDGEEHLVAVWPSDATFATRADALVQFADELGGDVLEIDTVPARSADLPDLGDTPDRGGHRSS